MEVPVSSPASVLDNEVGAAFARSVHRHASDFADDFHALYQRPHHRIYRKVGPGFLPLDLGRSFLRDCGRFVELVREIPDRIFGGDLGKLADYSRLSERDLELAMLQPEDGSWKLAARPDFIEGPEGPLFLEANIDSSLGGLGNTDRVARVVRASQAFASLSETYSCMPADPCTQLANVFRRAHRARDGYGEPRVAVLDWHEEIEEFPEPYVLLSGQLMAEGIHACIGDERELAFDGDVLCVRDQPVDVVFRGLVLDGYWRANRSLLQPLDEAYATGKVALVSNYRTLFFDNKLLLVLLSDEVYRERYSVEEQAFIHRTLPWTRRLQERRTERNGKVVDLIPHVREHKDELVLKPGGGSGALDVVAGAFHDMARWDGAISRAVVEGDWIVQQYVPPRESRFICYEEGEPREEVLACLWGAYVLNGRPSGFVLRAGPTYHGVISAAKGAGVGCVFLYH